MDPGPLRGTTAGKDKPMAIQYTPGTDCIMDMEPGTDWHTNSDITWQLADIQPWNHTTGKEMQEEQGYNTIKPYR